MVIDGSRRDEQPVGDLGVGQVLGEQHQHVGLTGGEPQRVVPGRPLRAARHSLDAFCLKLGTETAGEGNGIESIQNPERFESGIHVTAAEGHGQLVRNLPGPPHLGRFPPVALRQELVWLGSAVDHVVHEPGDTEPLPQFGAEPMAAELVAEIPYLDGAFQLPLADVAAQPVVLDHDRGGRAETLDLLGALSPRHGLQNPSLRITLPTSDQGLGQSHRCGGE